MNEKDANVYLIDTTQLTGIQVAKDRSTVTIVCGTEVGDVDTGIFQRIFIINYYN